MTIAPTHNGMYFSETVDMTGIDFLGGATFKDCAIETRDERRPWLPNCYFINCTFVGDVWPEGWRKASMVMADTDIGA